MRRVPIVMRPLGGMGNRMFQYMFSHVLAGRIPGGYVCNADLPEWSIAKLRPPLVWRYRALRVEGYHRYDLDTIAAAFREKRARSILFKGFAQRLGYYDRMEVSGFFDGRAVDAPTYGDEFLVIHVRAGDILDGSHRNYCPMPFAFFETLSRDSGRKPVFVGQVHDDNDYCRRLRQRFPDAAFAPKASPLTDFETLRRASHVVASVGSFAWLACWLSSARTIHLPVAGILDPAIRPDIDLLPPGDARYRFHKLDIGDWTASAERLAAFYGDAIKFRQIELRQLAR
ncbi:alpha-1,2-fucosyltransferase [Mesorhizobium sp. M4A.F.Ca.ET.022.05.2.1]|uniref:alpha-1,2-fucosyltransferase n=1 Tax=Mesorhizobium sp. M4A.F.Ca.ET.022.05.2.1 TaxID=2496653 RepID=UPI001676A79B|nr:alpha-1,2-fucosyltransferase [Mesorhizobium sp. M4A.F.Ca.ET.022.05.2.1]